MEIHRAGSRPSRQGPEDTFTGKVRIAASANGANVNEAKLVATDIDASNGVIHVIDSVLLPPKDSSTSANPREIIEHAVVRGVALYNRGHHTQCAAVYADAVRTMLTTADHGMSSHSVRTLQTALNSYDHTTCSQSRARSAWTLRRAMDTVYNTMPPVPGQTVR